MMAKGVISTELIYMSALQLDVSIPIILNNPAFIAKDQKGNHMYSNALKQFRMFRNVEHTDNAAEVETAIAQYGTYTETEKETLVKSRIGQGVFKKRLMEKYQGRCVITGLQTPCLLIASHVKPWAVSNNDERLSPENGLLLLAHYDRLFDSGLISFTDNGRMILSRKLPANDKTILGLTAGIECDLKMTPELKTNLEYHRDVVFMRQ